jgi:hypothetical protein
VIPRSHGRLVIIDEASALSPDDFGKLSRVRSEGIAEITKIASERTRADARLLWLSNPREGRQMSLYSYGVEAVRELVGQQEDIARFDMAITVAANEVDAREINRLIDSGTDASRFNAEDFRLLVLWAWSRNQNQVSFTAEAVNMVLQKALDLGAKYSGEVPLVQSENVRIKLAKIAAATAAMAFSTGETWDHLVVKPCHVLYAASFLEQLYDKTSMAYNQFSVRAHRRSKTSDVVTSKLKKVFDQLNDEYRINAVNAIRYNATVSRKMLAEHLGDEPVAGELLRQLIQADCLVPVAGKDVYRRTNSLMTFCRNYQ